MPESLNEIRTTLHNFLPDLKKRYPIESLALFGSVTRDDFDLEKSDIDILVVFNGDLGWEFFDLEKDIEKKLGHKVDLVAKEGIKPHYWDYISKNIVYV